MLTNAAQGDDARTFHVQMGFGKPPSCSAVLTSSLRTGYVHGKYFCLIHPRQRCRQDRRYASSFPFSRRAKTPRPDPVAVVAGGSEEVRHGFHEWCRTADITSRAKICGPSCICRQGCIDATRWSRPILRNSSCIRVRHDDGPIFR